jgi:hypothetical protein
LPNVKDEPRRELARRVQHYDSCTVVSFRSSFGRTRRDRSRRWLWRLVGLFSAPECHWLAGKRGRIPTC